MQATGRGKHSQIPAHYATAEFAERVARFFYGKAR